jgi:polyisoprenoid-binding protein YceI
MKKIVISILLLVYPCVFLTAQTYNLNREASKASVLGTSTLHDWESVVEKFKASTKLDGDVLSNVSFEAEVKSIKSGKSGMDKNTYKAMNADKYPVIRFTSDQLKVNGTKLTGTGKLTIAGETRDVPVNMNLEKWNEDSFTVSGSMKMKMSDFGVDPPTAMMGAIKTGDDIEIKIELSLNQ